MIEAYALVEDGTVAGSHDADRLGYSVGEGWAYSDTGYLVVGQLIEAFEEFAQNEALQRLKHRNQK